MIVYENSRFVRDGGPILTFSLLGCPAYGIGDYFDFPCEDATSFIYRTHRPNSHH